MHEYEDSDYLKIENDLFLRNNKDITAYVEGLEDELFWEDVFRKFAPSLKIIFYPYSRDNQFKSGKQAVLTEENLKDANEKLILCVDSDLDYLLKNEPVFSHPYVFHTYTYSIENYKIFPYNLNIIIKKCSLLFNQDFCFVKFFEEYSRAIYKLFLYIIYFEKQKYESLNKGEKAHAEITEKKLKNILCIEQSNIDLTNNGLNLIEFLKQRVEEFESEIIDKYGNIDLSTIDNELKKEFNLKEENIYWYIKGHILYDCVAKNLLPKIIKKYQKEKSQIYQVNSEDTENLQLQNKQNEYKNFIKKMDWETLLKDGHNSCLLYLDLCSPMQTIKGRIKQYYNIISKNLST